MAIVTAYFDASGNGLKQPHVVVSGYIANYLQWKLLESMWRKVHKDYGVDLPFHMADLISATSNSKYKDQKNARSDYVALAVDPGRAEQFFTNLSIAETTVVNCAVMAILPTAVYDEVDSLLDLRKVVPPYALAARICIDLVRDWERRCDVHEPVDCIFEEGDLE